MFEFWLSGWKEHAAISYIQLLLGIILVLIGVRLDKNRKEGAINWNESDRRIRILP